MTERTLDVLVVRWYERRDAARDILTRWLEAAEQHLPEALPRRFGDTEPLRGRLDRDGTAGLARAYAAADSVLFLAGRPPVHHADLGADHAPSQGGRGWGSTAVHALHVELDPTDDRIRRFALALTHPGTIYVSASVAGGMTLDGRTLYGPAEQREEPYLAPRGQWLGLPPEPPDWCWFGPAYAERVGRDLDGEPVGAGLLYTGGPWVPVALRARLSEVDPARRPAPWMPRGLRRSVLRFLFSG